MCPRQQSCISDSATNCTDQEVLIHTAVAERVHTCVLQLAELSVPLALCEPVTDMQRRGDFLEYVELLHEVPPQ